MPWCIVSRANLAGTKDFQRSRVQHEKNCSVQANPERSIEYGTALDCHQGFSLSTALQYGTGICPFQKYPEVLV